MSQAQDHTSPLLLARLLAGKASAAEVHAAEAHAEGCDLCRGELAEARAAGRRFAERVFPRTLPAVEARRGAGRSWRLLLPLGAAAFAAAAALLVLRASPPRPPGPLYQTKGQGALQVFGHRGEETFPVKDGTALRAGDRIRFGVIAGAARFVLVASVDGRGHASVYQPSTELAAGPQPLVLLPDSIVLDDAPGPERVFAVFSDRRLTETEVTAALTTLGAAGADAIRRATRLPLPWDQATVLIEKDPRSPRD